jgi:hypothetical protein
VVPAEDGVEADIQDQDQDQEALSDRQPADIVAAPAEPDELERMLSEEEEIERRTREHHETPHFRKEVD